MASRTQNVLRPQGVYTYTHSVHAPPLSLSRLLSCPMSLCARPALRYVAGELCGRGLPGQVLRGAGCAVVVSVVFCLSDLALRANNTRVPNGWQTRCREGEEKDKTYDPDHDPDPDQRSRL